MKIIRLIMASAVLKIAKIMVITSAITGETMAIKMAVMAGGRGKETLIITLMTVGSETAIRIKPAIDSSLKTGG